MTGKRGQFFLRFLALLLAISFTLPSSALALRNLEGVESDSVKGGLEESLKSGNPDAAFNAVTTRLAQLVAPLPTQLPVTPNAPAAGLEEPWKEKLKDLLKFLPLLKMPSQKITEGGATVFLSPVETLPRLAHGVKTLSTEESLEDFLYVVTGQRRSILEWEDVRIRHGDEETIREINRDLAGRFMTTELVLRSLDSELPPVSESDFFLIVRKALLGTKSYDLMEPESRAGFNKAVKFMEEVLPEILRRTIEVTQYPHFAAGLEERRLGVDEAVNKIIELIESDRKIRKLLFHPRNQNSIELDASGWSVETSRSRMVDELRGPVFEVLGTSDTLPKAVDISREADTIRVRPSLLPSPLWDGHDMFGTAAGLEEVEGLRKEIVAIRESAEKTGQYPDHQEIRQYAERLRSLYLDSFSKSLSSGDPLGRSHVQALKEKDYSQEDKLLQGLISLAGQRSHFREMAVDLLSFYLVTADQQTDDRVIKWIEAFLSSEKPSLTSREIERRATIIVTNPDRDWEVRQALSAQFASPLGPLGSGRDFVDFLAMKRSPERILLLGSLLEDAAREEDKREYPSIFWEGGTRQKVEDALRKLTYQDLTDASSPEEIHSKSLEKLTLNDVALLITKADAAHLNPFSVNVRIGEVRRKGVRRLVYRVELNPYTYAIEVFTSREGLSRLSVERYIGDSAQDLGVFIYAYENPKIFDQIVNELSRKTKGAGLEEMDEEKKAIERVRSDFLTVLSAPGARATSLVGIGPFQAEKHAKALRVLGGVVLTGQDSFVKERIFVVTPDAEQGLFLKELGITASKDPIVVVNELKEKFMTAPTQTVYYATDEERRAFQSAVELLGITTLELTGRPIESQLQTFLQQLLASLSGISPERIPELIDLGRLTKDIELLIKA